MQRTKKLEENKIKTREQKKGRKIKTLLRRQSTWLIIDLLLNHYCSAVAPISLRCRSVVAPLSQRYCIATVSLSLRCCLSVVALLSQRYCTATVPLSLRRCCYVVALLSHRYHIGIPPLLLRFCRSCCRYAVAPLSLRCQAVVEPQPLRPREGINNSILNCCCYTVTPLLLLLSIGRFTRLLPQEA